MDLLKQSLSDMVKCLPMSEPFKVTHKTSIVLYCVFVGQVKVVRALYKYDAQYVSTLSVYPSFQLEKTRRTTKGHMETNQCNCSSSFIILYYISYVLIVSTYKHFCIDTVAGPL